MKRMIILLFVMPVRISKNLDNASKRTIFKKKKSEYV